MFSDFDTEIVGFNPTKKSERLVNDGSSQTVPLKQSSEETQTCSTNSTSTQVVSSDLSKTSEFVEYDANKLLSFLQRVMPKLEEELHTFEICKENLGFDGGSNAVSGESDNGEEMESTQLFSFQIIIKPDFCKEKVVSDLTWNSTNVLLAVACSENTHEGWCNHETSVGLYRTEKEKFEKQPPDNLLKISSCAKCIQFHPYIPSLLAGGFHSGEIAIWDLTNGETLLTNTRGSENEVAHVDAVTCLVWRESRDGVWLVSTGRDGMIIFWKVSITNLSYEAVERFKILKQNGSFLGNALNRHLEILHIGFWSHKESDFVVAAGRILFHCSSTATKSIMSDPKFKDPVSMTYKQHEGIITCVSCSSLDVFASCGMDSKIQIYKFKMATPLQVIHTDYALLGIKWLNDNCLASWGCSSKVESYKIDLKSGMFESTTVCEVEDHVSIITVNSSRQRKVAIGSILGQVTVLCDIAL